MEGKVLATESHWYTYYYTCALTRSIVEVAGPPIVLHGTDEAQLGRNSCPQLHLWHHTHVPLKFHVPYVLYHML